MSGQREKEKYLRRYNCIFKNWGVLGVWWMRCDFKQYMLDCLDTLMVKLKAIYLVSNLVVTFLEPYLVDLEVVEMV